jgi:hypothetical protein
VELKNVPEGEIIKLIDLITDVYLEDEVNDWCKENAGWP